MDFFFLIISVIVTIVPICAHDRRTIQPYGISSSINAYNSNRLYNDRNVIVTTDCYDLCYDAIYSSTRSRRVSGCACSRFDFTGLDLGRGFNDRRYTTSCNCPSGTVCVRTNGRRSCVRRSRSRSNAGRLSINTNYPLNTGLPRRLGGHCGYLSSMCQASQRDLNQQVRFTYDYSLRRCVRERVHSICSPLGPRNNIFASLRTCNSMCM